MPSGKINRKDQDKAHFPEDYNNYNYSGALL